MSVIEIELKNPGKLQYVVELLRSLDFIAQVRIRPETPSSVADAEPVSVFDKYYGSLPDLDVDAFEAYLTQTRNEWERPRS